MTFPREQLNRINYASTTFNINIIFSSSRSLAVVACFMLSPRLRTSGKCVR